MSLIQHHILSNYPLSTSFRERIETLLGPGASYLNVSELRQTRSLPSIVAALRSLRGQKLTVAIEEDSSFALLPVLKMLAALSRSKHLQVVDPKCAIQAFGRLDALRMGIKLVTASIRSAVALRGATRELRKLAREERLHLREQSKQRVAYLNCNLWFGVKAGGSVGHISGVANALMDRGYELDFFTVGGRLMVDSRAHFRPLSAPEMLSLPFETTYYQFHRDCVRQIAPVLDQRPPSFLYQRMSLGNYTGVTLSRELRIPLILEYNGSEAWIAKNWGKPLRFHSAAVAAEQACLKHAQVVVTVSEPLGQELRERGVDPERIVVYPNCIDPRMFDPQRFSASEIQELRRKHGFAESDVIATFVGTFGQWHGVDVLANAIRRMIESDRDFLKTRRLRFLLIGDGQKMPLVRQILDVEGASEFVTLTGLVPQHEAPRYLAASDVLLSPHVANTDGSAFFGSPTKLFEYMAMEKAIYASDLDQIGQVLANSLRVRDTSVVEPTRADSSLAVLGRPSSIEDLIVGLRFLADGERWRNVLGSNARREALEKYTWDRHVDAILSRADALS